MLCTLCETFIVNLLDHDFVTWKRQSPTRDAHEHCRRSREALLTFKHGNYFTIQASAIAGCNMCALFHRERLRHLPDFAQLNQKWLYEHSHVDFKLDHLRHERTTRQRIEFLLSTKGPTMLWNEFELFRPYSLSPEGHGPKVWDSVELPHKAPNRADCEIAVCQSRKWLEECAVHDSCARPCASPLPSRLIDVGPRDGTLDPVLRYTGNQSGQYATLSHCWGSNPTFKTTKSNVDDHMSSIAFESLPPTFRDAISYTRHLGLRYLWIDALCILQDDESDWVREAAAMCSIFENGIVCLSAMFSQGSNDGFLQDFDVDQVYIDVQGLTLGVRPRIDTIIEAVQGSKLETRAWCLQERILAPALLYFGRHQLYWSCRTVIKPNLVFVNDTDNNETSAMDALCLGMRDLASLSESAALSAWWDVIKNYSARDITRPTDRLPAVAGLVERFHRKWQDRGYAHGLWSHALLAGLLWRREPSLHRSRVNTDNGVRTRSIDSGHDVNGSHVLSSQRRGIGPSWSWASVNAAVSYDWQSGLTFPPLESFDQQAMCLSHLAGNQDGILRFKAHVKRGVCRLDSDRFLLTGDAHFRPSNSKIMDDTLSCRLDYSDEYVVAKPCYSMRVATFGTENVEPHAGTANSFYLLLERVARGEKEERDSSIPHFKRIGVGVGPVRKVDKVFANAVKHTLELV